MTKKSLHYFLKASVIIIATAFFVDKVIFVAFNTISDKVFSGQSLGKLNHYLALKDTLDFVVFGSSRANHHVDPKEIPGNGFNMGVDATKIAYSSTLLKLLPEKKPQIILIQIDPENVFSKEYSGRDIQGLKLKYNRNEIIKENIVNLGQKNFLQDFFWSLSYNGKILGILKNYFIPKYDYRNYFGYDPIYVNSVQRNVFENILKKERIEKCPQEYKLNKIYASRLMDIKAFCQKEGKKLIFFTAPKLNDPCMEDNVHFNKLMKNKKLTYHDFTDFFKGKDSIIYWKDLSHLSHRGAAIFTDSIKGIMLH